jgi:hypothetical protein
VIAIKDRNYGAKIMRNKIIQLGLLIGLAVSLAGFAKAQTAAQYRLKIPFDFTVGGQHFQAGDYAINFGGLSGNLRRLVIQSRKSKEAAIAVVSPKETTLQRKEQNNAVLVFKVYENQYFLAEIETPLSGAELSKSKSESRLAKNAKRVEVVLMK